MNVAVFPLIISDFPFKIDCICCNINLCNEWYVTSCGYVSFAFISTGISTSITPISSGSMAVLSLLLVVAVAYAPVLSQLWLY